MKILYRISDGGYNKIKPHYVTKQGVFLHFYEIFKNYDIYVFADNVNDDTHEFLKKSIPEERIFRTNLSNAGSFMFSLDFAIKFFNDDDKIYFAEDDYIYTREAPTVIEEGLNLGHYSSGYDHPDKYIKGGIESTHVLITKSKHWKFTKSCCMTFASTLKTLKTDYNIFSKHCCTTHPYDFQLFTELRVVKNRKIVSCIPAVSTHGETEWLSKFIDWENEFEKTKPT